MEELLAEIKAKGYNVRLTSSKHWQCDISLGSWLNVTTQCCDTPAEALFQCWVFAREGLKPEEKFNVDSLLTELNL